MIFLPPALACSVVIRLGAVSLVGITFGRKEKTSAGLTAFFCPYNQEQFLRQVV